MTAVKTKRLSLIFFLFLCSALISGQERMKVIKDDFNDSFSFAAPPKRIVSMAPNITEILFALGLEGETVGVTRYCDYPAGAPLKEKIGGMLDPNPEKIKALDPDLIIAFRGNPLTTIRHLKKLRFPVFVLESGKSLEDVYAIIEKIGTITFREEKAAALNSSLKAKQFQVEQALSSVTHKPRVFLSLHGMGFWTCGRESFLDDLLGKAKGVNIAGGIPKKWILLNQEQLLSENPDIILLLATSKEDFLRGMDWLKNKPSLGHIRAIKNGRIHFLDENLASRFGPRLLDAFSEMARLLHPEKF